MAHDKTERPLRLVVDNTSTPPFSCNDNGGRDEVADACYGYRVQIPEIDMERALTSDEFLLRHGYRANSSGTWGYDLAGPTDT